MVKVLTLCGMDSGLLGSLWVVVAVMAILFRPQHYAFCKADEEKCLLEGVIDGLAIGSCVLRKSQRQSAICFQSLTNCR